jgi:hypothetical protein
MLSRSNKGVRDVCKCHSKSEGVTFGKLFVAAVCFGGVLAAAFYVAGFNPFTL